MPKVTYVDPSGAQHVIDAKLGDSLMTTAVQNGVPGIVGECGGNASCATCHVWVQDDYASVVGPPGDFEDDLLDLATTERRSTSRLGCQVQVTELLDGVTVDVPPVQP